MMLAMFMSVNGMQRDCDHDSPRLTLADAAETSNEAALTNQEEAVQATPLDVSPNTTDHNEGDLVEVAEEFISNDQMKTTLKKGLRGRIAQITDNGQTIIIEWDGIDQRNRKNFLGPGNPASAVDRENFYKLKTAKVIYEGPHIRGYVTFGSFVLTPSHNPFGRSAPLPMSSNSDGPQPEPETIVTASTPSPTHTSNNGELLLEHLLTAATEHHDPFLERFEHGIRQHVAQSTNSQSLIAVNSMEEIKALFKDDVFSWGPEGYPKYFHIPHRKSIVVRYQSGESILTPARGASGMPNAPTYIFYASERPLLMLAYCVNTRNNAKTFLLNNLEVVFNEDKGKFFLLHGPPSWFLQDHPVESGILSDMESGRHGFTISYDPSSTSFASSGDRCQPM